MGELKLAYETRCYSTGIVGRSICNARNQHWVAENSGGEAMGAGEMFCGSIAACAVNMIETIASTENRALDGMEARVAVYRNFDKKPGEVSLYDRARIDFELWGVSDEDAKFLVKAWKQR